MPNGLAIFRREPPNGDVECRWVRQKTTFWTNIWLRCIQVYTVVNRVAMCDKQSCDGRRRASSTPRRPLFAQDDDEVFVVGSMLYARDGGQTPPSPTDTTPLVITPFSAVVGHRMTEPGWYFCWKLTLPVLLTLSDPWLGVLTPTNPRTAENKGVI